MTVREAKREDTSAVGEIHAAAWSVGYRDIFEPDVLARGAELRRTRWSALYDTPEFGATTLLVVERDDAIVGFANIGPADADGYEGGWIHSFYVHPAHWGSGVAEELIVEVFDRLAEMGYSRAGLTTFAAAARARGFYEKVGFRQTGRTSVSVGAGFPPVPDVEYSKVLVAGTSAGEVATH